MFGFYDIHMYEFNGIIWFKLQGYIYQLWIAEGSFLFCF